MKEILKRLQSPVVIAQLVSIIGGVIVFFAPQATDSVKVIAGAIVAIVNIFAGLNNPTDKANF